MKPQNGIDGNDWSSADSLSSDVEGSALVGGRTRGSCRESQIEAPTGLQSPLLESLAAISFKKLFPSK